jgi:hypothetical protein
VIIGNDDVDPVDAVSSAVAETLLKRSRDSAALTDFIGLLSWRVVNAQITEQNWTSSIHKMCSFCLFRWVCLIGHSKKNPAISDWVSFLR